MNEVSLESRQKFDYCIVDIAGDIELEDVSYVKSHIDNSLNTEINSLVLNLARVSYMNNSAISLFVELMEDCRRNGIRFYLMNITGKLDSLLIRANIKKYLSVIESEDMLTEQAKENDLNSLLDEPF